MLPGGLISAAAPAPAADATIPKPGGAPKRGRQMSLMASGGSQPFDDEMKKALSEPTIDEEGEEATYLIWEIDNVLFSNALDCAVACLSVMF